VKLNFAHLNDSFLLLSLLTEDQSSKLHLAVQRDYPEAQQLPLPPNIDVAETARFSPLRNRDISASAIIVHESKIDVTFEQPSSAMPEPIAFSDPHVDHSDRQSSVSLGAVMQSTVPEPFGGNHGFSYLNMPGGQWGQQTKYLSHELNSAHYTELRQDLRSDWNDYSGKGTGKLLLNHLLLKPSSPFVTINKRFISLNANLLNNDHAQKTTQTSSDVKSPPTPPSPPPEKESNQSKLKRAVKEYGSTVIVFHVGISLVSLGLSFALVSR